VVRFLLTVFCLSSATYSSIERNIKSLDVSDVRCSLSDVRTSNGHNSATHHPIAVMFVSRVGWGFRRRQIARCHFRLDQIHPIDFVFGSRLGFLARTD